MDKLEILLQNWAGKEYSCIQEGDVAIAPCYLVNPYGMGALKGNGICAEQTLQSEVCFFVETKKTAVEIATQLRQRFVMNKYVCMDLEIEYEKSAKAWRVILLVEHVLERNETE